MLQDVQQRHAHFTKVGFKHFQSLEGNRNNNNNNRAEKENHHQRSDITLIVRKFLRITIDTTWVYVDNKKVSEFRLNYF